MEPGKPILLSKRLLFVKKISYFSTTRSRFWICNDTQDLWTAECDLARNHVDSSTLDGRIAYPTFNFLTKHMLSLLEARWVYYITSGTGLCRWTIAIKLQGPAKLGLRF